MDFLKMDTPAFFRLLGDEPSLLRRIVAWLVSPDGNHTVVATSVATSVAPMVLRDDFIEIIGIDRTGNRGMLVQSTSDVPTSVLAQMYEFLYGEPKGYLQFDSGYRFQSLQTGRKPVNAYFLPKRGNDAPEVLSTDVGITRLMLPIVSSEEVILRGFTEDGTAQCGSLQGNTTLRWNKYYTPEFPEEVVVHGSEFLGREVLYATTDGIRTSLMEGEPFDFSKGEDYRHLFRVPGEGLFAIRDHGVGGGGEVIVLEKAAPQLSRTLKEPVMEHLRSASTILVDNSSKKPNAVGVVEFEPNRYHLERFPFRE